MMKCRYDFSIDCHNKNCLTCIIDKIKIEIDAQIELYDTPFEIDGGIDESYRKGLNKALEIIDKCMVESKE